VDKALIRVRRILDNTRHPRLFEPTDDHTYADKFALAEFCTNAAVAAQMNALERLGLDAEKLRTVLGWVHDDKRSVTMRLEASDACSFFKERDVDVVTGEREVEITTTSSSNANANNAPSSASSGGFLSSMAGVVTGGTGISTAPVASPPSPAGTAASAGGDSKAETSTTRVKVVTKVKEYHWKVEVKHRLVVFAGADPASSAAPDGGGGASVVELQSRSTSAFVVTSGGQARPTGGGILPRPRGAGSTKPPMPVPESTVHPPVDVSLTWFFSQIEPKDQVCRFHVDRDSVKAQRTCRTPRRNDDVQGAFDYYRGLNEWSGRVQGYLLGRVEGEIAGSHSPAQRSGLASASPETVEAGSRGTIVGLQKEPTFNGKGVVVLEYSPDQNRFRVEPVDKAASGLPPTLLIKPQNLRVDHNASGDGPSLSDVTTDSLFCPVLPLAEDGAPVLGDVSELLNEQCRSLDEALDGLARRFPPRQLVKLVSVAEAGLVLVARHLEDLSVSYQDSVDYVEHMLKQQLVKAVGKEIASRDFDAFMVFHNRRLFRPEYAPVPFTYAVRRPGHFPSGTFTIECTRQRNEPIHTMVRHIPAGGNGASGPSASVRMPLSAATSVELTGDRYLHGWMLHRFKTKPRSEYELVARARQFSSFMVVIGTVQGPSSFEPKDAIILQNKDEVMIPLLTTALPSAKEFKDSIASLSPEQRAFAQSYRAMQLESSVFGVCIVEIKPQLERLLGLPEGSLTKEIRLTQDLMSLFTEYQIPSDLLTYDGPATSDAAAKVDAVRGYVKSILDVIEGSKERQLIEEERRADMRAEMASGAKPGGGGGFPFGGAPAVGVAGGFGSAAVASPFGTTSTFGGPPGTLFGSPSPQIPPEHQAMMLEASMADSSEVSRSGRGGGMRSITFYRKNKSATPAPPPAPAATAMRQSSIPSMNVRVESIQPGSPSNKPGQAPGRGGPASPSSAPASSAEGEDFTLIPKVLDAKLERFDTDGALRSTIIKAGTAWTLSRQDNLLTPPRTSTISGRAVESEKAKAFDLLDAISRSGSLPIPSSELHVVVAVSHCFENDVMGSIVQDNVNPIDKVEKSSLLLASVVHGGRAPMSLVRDEAEVQRLTQSFPELASSGSRVEIYSDQD
jgi:hypothetical protein